MKIVKTSKNPDLYSITECSEDDLVAFYNITLNYRSYLNELLKKPDNIILSLAPGKDAKTVRQNFRSQIKTANDYVDVWQEIINKADDNKPQA